ncbi:ACT domain-containing protein [Texcoconibacillus texcoconensis]|uniref:UPF0237 protein HNQ41_001888 n=1 Tax=Texcoconibacillus texcoconensis TaxID=1095777 RepID=A0A840QQS6_9BACI|nr:ACT domain-containing protein [Texcoconibacillus texcoconensis]MBB5173699.1 ACT domain-containing protein [Texcoconibacillus texcoconensis]
MTQTRAVVSVVGKDQVGIIAKVTGVLAEHKFNVLDINQTILQDFFTMMMLIDVKDSNKITELEKDLNKVSEELALEINIQREEIFQAMHRI